MTDLPTIPDDIEVYAALPGCFPRLVAKMTRSEWLAGKEIPRESPLTWGEASQAVLERERCVQIALHAVPCSGDCGPACDTARDIAAKIRSGE